MFHRLLVPLDGTKAAESILPLARSLLDHEGARVVLLHVLKGDENESAAAEKALKRVAGRLRKAHVRTMVVQGTPARSILRESDRLCVDGIAISSRNLSDELGSVCRDIVERSRIPVAVWVRHKGQKATVRKPNKILVLLDGTSESERVLDFVDEAMDRRGRKATLLRVGRSHWALGGLTPTSQPTSELREYLKVCAARLKHAKNARCLVRRGDALRCIVDSAREHDLVMLASHHRKGISKVIHGSIAQELLDASPAPLLIV